MPLLPTLQLHDRMPVIIPENDYERLRTKSSTAPIARIGHGNLAYRAASISAPPVLLDVGIAAFAASSHVPWLQTR
jgi:hypothetical protein